MDSASFAPFVELFSVDGIELIGNFDSGAVVGLTPQAARACRRVAKQAGDVSEIAEVDEGLVSFLKQGGFFDCKSSHDHARSAYVHVTQRCNLDCVGCYSMRASRNSAPDPSASDLRRVFSQLAECGARAVNISGGEPFLRDDLCDIVRAARDECGLPTVNVVTNGAVDGRFPLSELAKWVSSVTVSIDGPSANAPACIRREQRFDMLVCRIRELRDAGINTRILPTLHARNIEDVPAYVELARELGVGLNFSLLSCPPNASDMCGLVPSVADLERLAELQMEGVGFAVDSGPFGVRLEAKRSCGAGRKNVSVDVDGSVYPCHMLHAEEFLMGNVFVDDLRGIIERATADVAGWLPPTGRIESCRSCEYGPVCGGGCRARAINCGAGPVGEDPYCSLNRSVYRRMFSALSEAVRKNREEVCDAVLQ